MVVVPGRSVGMGEHQPDAGRGPNLLLIDRQPLFLAALGSLLTAPPVRASVQVANDTGAGLEIALRGDVQLVFCEIRSEPIPAIDLVERLSQLTPRVPVIVLGDAE